jgi:hypothetical protein
MPPAGADQPPVLEAKSEAVEPPARPRRPERPRKPTDRERRATALARILRADERYLARQAALAGEDPGASQAGPERAGIDLAVAAAEPQAEALPAEPQAEAFPADPLGADASPEERLEALGVLLAPSALNHILNFHGARAPQGWTPLHPDFHSREALASLLADQLERAGEIGRIRRPRAAPEPGLVPGAVRGAQARHLRVLDLEGSYRTYCRTGRRVDAPEAPEPACTTLVVVTQRVQDLDGEPYHDIITAYTAAEAAAW